MKKLTKGIVIAVASTVLAACILFSAAASTQGGILSPEDLSNPQSYMA